MPRPAHFVLKRSLGLPVVMAGAAGLGLATALPVAAQTAPPQLRAAVMPPINAAPPAMPAAMPPVVAASSARPPQRAASQPAPKVAGAASPGMAASSATARWVALDIGHLPGGGSRSASGVAEHNFNLRFAATLESRLLQQGIAVRRLPSSLSLADRARRAQGAALVVSVHHDSTSPAALARAASASVEQSESVPTA
jgi:N-acetylmuramoyl-L-alanine amidase